MKFSTFCLEFTRTSYGATEAALAPYIYDLQRFQISRPPYFHHLYDPWSHQGFEGFIVKKFHTPMGPPMKCNEQLKSSVQSANQT